MPLLAFHRLGQGAHPAPRLSPAEAARARRLSGRRRSQYLAGRWLLREICALGRGGRPWEWSLNAEGPPRASHPRQRSPWLSLSHSGDWVVAALANGPGVGVDLEAWGQPRDWTALKRLLDRWGVAPAGAARSGLGREESFLRAWTGYEACYKARAGAPRTKTGPAAGWTLACGAWICQAVGPANEGLQWLNLGAGTALPGWRTPQGPWAAALPKADQTG